MGHLNTTHNSFLMQMNLLWTNTCPGRPHFHFQKWLSIAGSTVLAKRTNCLFLLSKLLGIIIIQIKVIELLTFQGLILIKEEHNIIENEILAL